MRTGTKEGDTALQGPRQTHHVADRGNGEVAGQHACKLDSDGYLHRGDDVAWMGAGPGYKRAERTLDTTWPLCASDALMKRRKARTRRLPGGQGVRRFGPSATASHVRENTWTQVVGLVQRRRAIESV